MRRLTLASWLLLPCLSAGCGNNTFATLTSATTAPAVIVTDTFSGTVTRNGATSHPFDVSFVGGGDVTAVIRAIAPERESVVGLSLGEWNGASCAIKISVDRATVGSSMLGRATGAGTLCVRIFDSGSLTTAQDYEIQVTHP